MTESDLDDLLRYWAAGIIKEIDSGWKGMTPSFTKIRVEGVAIRVPNYWPNRRVYRLHEAIFSLETSLRDTIILLYLIGLKPREAIEYLNMEVGEVYQARRRARRRLLSQLTN